MRKVYLPHKIRFKDYRSLILHHNPKLILYEELFVFCIIYYRSIEHTV